MIRLSSELLSKEGPFFLPKSSRESNYKTIFVVTLSSSKSLSSIVCLVFTVHVFFSFDWIANDTQDLHEIQLVAWTLLWLIWETLDSGNARSSVTQHQLNSAREYAICFTHVIPFCLHSAPAKEVVLYLLYRLGNRDSESSCWGPGSPHQHRSYAGFVFSMVLA